MTALHTLALVKPDGRDLVLYGRAPIDPALQAPMAGARGDAGAELRWHPLRGEWVVYAAHRQRRTYLPPPDWNPLAPSRDPDHPTEVPAGAWDVAVFENRFPALGAPDGTLAHGEDRMPCGGRCEVVVFSQDPETSLAELPVDRLELILAVWGERTRALAARADVAYVFAFENRGVEVGATLHHPHGQIYAYPFVPPIAARALERELAYHAYHGRTLVEDLVAAEVAQDVRTVHVGAGAVAFVPVCARWAYEIWVAPRRPVASIADVGDDVRLDLARALSRALRKLDGLWQRPMPYVLALHQAPARGAHPYAHLRIEIYPWQRLPGRLKHLAGSEVGAGTFTADTLPEDTAAELRAVEVDDE
jgi:UDPglucose--hexose-1-phosphate uridylyltransferase